MALDTEVGPEVGGENVASLWGDPIITNKPDSDVVELFEEMLEAARSGEIIGFAGAVLHGDRSTSRRKAGTSSYAMLGALTAVLHRLTNQHLTE